MERRENVRSQLRDREAWESWYRDQVFLGPSAAEHGVNRSCYAAWERGLIGTGEDKFSDKFSLIRIMAEIKFHTQPNGSPPKPLEKPDLAQIAEKIKREPEMVRAVAGLMTEFNLIASPDS